MAMVLSDRITKTPSVQGGKACIAGHRIRVMDIVMWHEDLSMGPDEIVAAHPTLTLSDVHAALAYYFDNVAEIRNDIRHNEDVADRLQTLVNLRGKFKGKGLLKTLMAERNRD
jgi:uncharacterized protein (DUF433 family)